MDNNNIHCTLTDAELSSKADQWIDELILSGGKSWTMQVPARPNADTDLIFVELNNRFKIKLKEYGELKAENEALKQQVATLHEKKRRGAEEHRKLFLEHATLKDRAQGLADALGNARKSMVGEDAIKEVDATLQSWNQGNEVLGKGGEV